jgi:ABC-type proline/glycine betaine transport system permease subunit
MAPVLPGDQVSGRQLLDWFAGFLGDAPPTVVVILVGLVAWQSGGRGLGLTVLGALIFTGIIGCGKTR